MRTLRSVQRSKCEVLRGEDIETHIFKCEQKLREQRRVTGGLQWGDYRKSRQVGRIIGCCQKNICTT